MGWTIRGLNSGKGKKVFFFTKTTIPAPEPIQPAIQWVPEFFLGGKTAGV
jgi:hypothetical protein